LETPNDERKVLLHVCCAVCAGEVLEALSASGLHTTVFFYNPNVHPVEEYERRKQETLRFVDKLGIASIDADYDAENWFEVVRGHEDDPERGERCQLCFDMRLSRAAACAAAHRIPLLATTLGISRWKDLEMVNAAGAQAVAPYEGVAFWDFNWRKKGGSQRMSEIARRENFYRQDYCGCVFSRRTDGELGA
jgi:hypothetical protein